MRLNCQFQPKNDEWWWHMIRKTDKNQFTTPPKNAKIIKFSQRIEWCEKQTSCKKQWNAKVICINAAAVSNAFCVYIYNRTASKKKKNYEKIPYEMIFWNMIKNAVSTPFRPELQSQYLKANGSEELHKCILKLHNNNRVSSFVCYNHGTPHCLSLITVVPFSFSLCSFLFILLLTILMQNVIENEWAKKRQNQQQHHKRI